MNDSFFNKIIYSACNEDSESECKALALTQADIVLCITGSGARPLDLLVDEPKKIISVDLNAHQNHLLALKIACYRTLSYPEFVAFIGLRPSVDRLKLFPKVAVALSDKAKAYWKDNISKIEAGVLYCGVWERLLKGMSYAAFFRKRKIDKLMAAQTIDEQRAYWDKSWDTIFWHMFLRAICNRFLWTKIIREPGALLIPKEFDVYAYMQERLRYAASHHLLGSSHFAHLMFYGQYGEACILPLHLQERHFETIKNNVHKVEIFNDTLYNVLQQKEITTSVTAYSLSDFSSYAEPDTYESIWRSLAGNARPGARFCERQFLVKRSPENISANIIRDHELEQRLENEDLAFIYSFCVGHIGVNCPSKFYVTQA